jgi:hypothetical protein
LQSRQQKRRREYSTRPNPNLPFFGPAMLLRAYEKADPSASLRLGMTIPVRFLLCNWVPGRLN